MVKFKALKYKHRLQAQELNAGIEAGTVTETQLIEFVTGMIEAWDYLDVETGQPIPLGDYGELSIEQFTEVMELFNQEMQEKKAVAVKKKTESNSSYGLTKSKRARRAMTQTRPNGLT